MVNTVRNDKLRIQREKQKERTAKLQKKKRAEPVPSKSADDDNFDTLDVYEDEEDVVTQDEKRRFEDVEVYEVRTGAELANRSRR